MGAHELREEVERRLAARRAERPSGPIATFPFEVGRYTVLSVLSEGAGGSVYRAHQEHPDREVALKLLVREAGALDDPRLLAAELRALALLRHPGVVHLYDAGTVAIHGMHYSFLAMELVEGVSLAKWVERDLPDLSARLQLLISVCAAIHAAHQRGVVHRDLKPDNILVRTVDGLPQPCVLDFGIARIAADNVQAAAESGRLYGSLDYMSPEQASGSQVIDVRTDVYALGAIAYWMCSGTAPIPVDALPLAEALQWIRTEQPAALRQRDARISSDLEDVIRKALAKLPEDRYPSVQALAADLQATTDHRPVSVRRATLAYSMRCFARRQRALCAALVTAGVAVLFAVGLGWWGYARSSAERDRLLAVSQAAMSKMLGPLGSMAGTSQARRALLLELLPQVEACERVRPDDLQALQCHYEILRMVGDIDADDGRWSSAMDFRSRAQQLQERIVELEPASALARAELATALVRVGDSELRIRGELAAKASYAQAHAVYLKLGSENPDSGRHIDDLAWSHDRMGQMAMRMGQFERAEEFIQARADLNERLRLLRPGHSTTYSGQRSLHLMRVHLAQRRGLHDEEMRELLMAIEPARAHWRLEPNSPLVTTDLCNVLISYVYFAGRDLPLGAAYEMLSEAQTLLEDLLRREPKNELARQMYAWSRCVRGLHRAYQEAEPLMAALQRARSHLAFAEDLLRANITAVYEDAVRAAKAEVAKIEESDQQPAELPQLQSWLATVEALALSER